MYDIVERKGLHREHNINADSLRKFIRKVCYNCVKHTDMPPLLNMLLAHIILQGLLLWAFNLLTR